MVRGADDDGVEAFFLFEEFAVIRVGGTAAGVSGVGASGIVGVDDFLCGFAAGNAASSRKSVVEFYGLIGTEPIPTGVHAEQFADGVAEFVRAPLRVVGAGFVDVADGNALHVG